MVKKRYTHIPAKKRAPLVENIDSFDQVRRNSGTSVVNIGTPMTDRQAAQLRNAGVKPYCLTGNQNSLPGNNNVFTNKDDAEAYCDRVEAYYRANGIMYYDRKFKKMSYELTKEEIASYDQKTSSTKDSEDDNVSDGEQKTSSAKDEEKITVADERESNPGIPTESKKVMVASSEVDPPISKDLSSFAAGDCLEGTKVENVNKIDQVDSLKGEFHISFESEGSPDVVKTRDEPVKEKEMGEGEAELRNAINKGMRRGFPFSKESKETPISKNANSLVGCIPALEAGDCPNVTKTRDGPVKGEEEEEWHDEAWHGSFNPADPKCKCAIS